MLYIFHGQGKDELKLVSLLQNKTLYLHLIFFFLPFPASLYSSLWDNVIYCIPDSFQKQ